MGRAIASGRYPRWAGGLPAGRTRREHLQSSWELPGCPASQAQGPCLPLSLRVGKSSEDPPGRATLLGPNGDLRASPSSTSCCSAGLGR